MSTLPVPVPRTATVAEVETGAYANSLRDALNFLLNPPLAVLTQTSAQATTTGTLTAITYDSTFTDTYNGHSNSVNPSRYTAQVAGWYLLNGTAAYLANGGGIRYAQYAKNATALTTSFSGPQPANGTFVGAAGTSTIVQLNAGDYVELDGFQSSGGGLNTQPSYCTMNIAWLHA